MVVRASLALVAAVALLAAAPMVRAGGAPKDAAFLSGIADLPLMRELDEQEASGLVFDTPAGRIVEAFATGPVSRAEVLSFYAATLPQLGWTAEGEARFRREGEVLSLEFPDGDAAAAGRALTVRFSLSPDASGAVKN